MKKSSGNKRRLNKKAPSLLALEPRLMFDGAVALTVDQTPTQPEPTVQEAALDEPAVKTASYAQPKDESESSTAEPATLEDDATTHPESSGAEDSNLDIDDEAIEDESAGKRLVLISGYLPEVDQIASDLSKNATVHILRADGNIVDEISEILATYQSVDELHVVSHGQPGALVFGTEVLDAEALNNQSKQVSSWGSQLSPDADILLYGCDVASEPSGIVFLKTLQGLTGADIAASDDATGAQSLGGDAELEVEYGDIESSTALTSELLNRLDLVLDITPPRIDTVEVNITDTTLSVILNMSESIAADQALEDSELYVNVAGIDHYASYVPEDANNPSNPLASNPTDASNARLVYQLDNVTQADLSLGLRMGQIVFDENSGEVVDSNNNALVPINVSDLVTEVHVDDGETLVFGGGFVGSGDFVKTGAGELILTGANTHAGKTIVQGGTLTISSDDQLGSTTAGADRVVVQAGATLAITESVTLTPGRGITLGDGAAIAVAAGETMTYGGVIQGVDGAAIKEGEGELKLTGANNFAEGLKIDAGRLTLTNASGIVSSAGVEIGANGTLDMTGNNETIGSLSGAGRVELGARYLTVDTSGTSEFSGVIEGTGRLITTGTGVLILSGQNQYTGYTEIKESSTLRLGADHALNNKSLVYLYDSAKFDVDGHKQAVDDLTSANNASNSEVDLGETETGRLELGASNTSKNFYGGFTGAGELVKRGTGTFNLYGESSHSGRTFIAEGSLRLVGANASLSSGSGPATAVLITDKGKLDLYNGGNQTIGSLAGAGDVVANNNTLSVGSDGSTTRFNGVLNTGSGGKLIKEGAGTFALGGSAANNTHSLVEVAAGTLLLDKHSGDSARLAVGTSNNVVALSIASGATVKLGGSDSLSASDALSQVNSTSNIQIDAGGTLDLNGRRLAVNDIIGAGDIVNNGHQKAVLEVGRSSASFTLGASMTAGTNGHGIELVKSGTGTLTIDTAVSYAGVEQLTIDNGTVTQNGANTLSVDTDVVIANAKTLNLGGHDLTIGGLSGAGNVVLGNGTLTAGSNADHFLTGVISGSGGLVKAGSGQLTLGGNQTYTGATSVNAGELRFGDGASRLLPTTSGITVATGAAVAFESSGTVTMQAGFISGAGAFIKDGTGQLTLAGANDFAAGSTLVDGTIVLGGFSTTNGEDLTGLGTGTVTVSGEATLKTASGVQPVLPNDFVIANGATLHFDSINTNSTMTLAGDISGAGDFTAYTRVDTAIILTGDVNIGGEITIKATGTYKTSLQIGDGGTTGTLQASNIYAQRYGGLVYDHVTGHSVTLDTRFEGDGQFIKNGDGTVLLTAPLRHSHLGETLINDGVLVMGADNLLSVDSHLRVESGGTLNLDGHDQKVASLYNDATPGGGAIDTGAGGVLSLLANNTRTFDGVISGAGGLIKDGTGRLYLTGPNTYTGATQILAGYLRIGNSGDASVQALSDQTAVFVADGAELEVYPASQSVGSIAGEGIINLYSYTLTVGGNNLPTTFAGVIEGNGSSGLVKAGSGTLELSGVNTYSGTTTVENGELKLNGTLGSTAITVQNGGSLTGEGQTGSSITIESGGTLDPGGPLAMQGVLTVDAGATLVMDLVDNGNSRLDDEISGVTDLVLNGDAIVRVGDGDLSDRDWGSWRLIQYSGTASGAGLNLVTSEVDFPTTAADHVLALTNVETNTSDKTLQLRLQPVNTSGFFAAPFDLSLNAADDTGTSNRDDITSKVTQRVTGYADPGSQVILFSDRNNNGYVDEGEWLTTAPLTAHGTTGLFSTTLELGSGTHHVRAVMVDNAGQYSTTSDALVITVDRQSPFAPNAPIPLEGADTGVSDADFVTNNQRPGFRLELPTLDKGVHPSVAAVEGMRLTLEARTTVLASHLLTASDISLGYVDLTPDMYIQDMWDGGNFTSSWRLRGVLTDVAGNESTRQLGWSLPAWRTDTTPPDAPIMNHSTYPSPLMDSSDSGSNNRDRVTNHTTDLGFNFLQHTHAVSTEATLTRSDGSSWEIEAT